ncbi:MAG TPA: hypothetical protein VMT16_01635 [Thermoanaerobaculia bacterium]|nr:hypothetical protein [Thermoanaerobaculia bacterium]
MEHRPPPSSEIRPAPGRVAPGPRGSLLLGNLPELPRDPLGSTERWVRGRLADRHVYSFGHPGLVEPVRLERRPEPAGAAAALA